MTLKKLNQYKEIAVWLFLSTPFLISIFIIHSIYPRFVVPILFIGLLILMLKKSRLSVNTSLIVYMTLIFFLLADIILILFQGKSFDLKSINLMTTDSLVAGFAQFPFYSITILFLLFFLFFITRYLLKKIALSNKNLSRKTYISFNLLTLLFTLPSSFSFSTNKLITHQFYKVYLKDNVQLPTIDLKATKGKNLLLIYLESFETEYAERDNFPTLTPFLQDFTVNSISFESNYMIDGANFSLAGMFSSQCGAPLQYRNTKNLICLGDILHKADYKQIFMQGSDMKFEDMDAYYIKQGYNELYGKKKLLPIGDKDKVNDWGTTDEDLFEYAYIQFNKLHKEYIKTKQPYNLTLFTSDTHNGQPSPSCPKYIGLFEENHFFQSYHCTDYLLNKFISKIRKQPGSENLIIALIGDHLQNFDIYASKLNKMDRRVLAIIHTPNRKSIKITQKTNHTHFTPTLLSSMGIKTNAKFLFGTDVLDIKNEENIKVLSKTFEEKKLYQMINSDSWIESIGFQKKKEIEKKKEILDLYSYGAGIKNISKKEINKYFLPEIEHYKKFSNTNTKIYYSIEDNILFMKSDKFFNEVHLKFLTDNNHFFDGIISASKAMELPHNWYVWVFSNKIKGVNSLRIKINEVTQDKVFRDQVLVRDNNNFIEFNLKLKSQNVIVAFYLYKNNKRVDTQWYSKNFSYKLDKGKFGKGKYKIRYFTVGENTKNLTNSVKTDGFSEEIDIP